LAATEFSVIFSGIQPRQYVKFFPTFRELTPSPSSGCAGGLVAPKPMSDSWLSQQFWCYKTTSTPWRWGRS